MRTKPYVSTTIFVYPLNSGLSASIALAKSDVIKVPIYSLGNHPGGRSQEGLGGHCLQAEGFTLQGDGEAHKPGACSGSVATKFWTFRWSTTVGPAVNMDGAIARLAAT